MINTSFLQALLRGAGGQCSGQPQNMQVGKPFLFQSLPEVRFAAHDFLVPLLQPRSVSKGRNKLLSTHLVGLFAARLLWAPSYERFMVCCVGFPTLVRPFVFDLYLTLIRLHFRVPVNCTACFSRGSLLRKKSFMLRAPKLNPNLAL